MSTNPTRRQKLFIEYLLSLPIEERKANAATSAAIYAGYAEKTAKVQGSRLFHHPKVVEALRDNIISKPKSDNAMNSFAGPGKENVKSREDKNVMNSADSSRRFGVCQLEGWIDKDDQRRQVGRPSLYSEEIADEICEVFSKSRLSLQDVCDGNERFPSGRTVQRWLAENVEFRHRYARAREEQGDFLAYESLKVAYDDSLDLGFKDDGTPFVDRENIARSKLKIDTNKWVASRLHPKKWGDKIDLTSAGASINPLAALIEEITEVPQPPLALSKRYRVIEVTPNEKGEYE